MNKQSKGRGKSGEVWLGAISNVLQKLMARTQGTTCTFH